LPAVSQRIAFAVERLHEAYVDYFVILDLQDLGEIPRPFDLPLGALGVRKRDHVNVVILGKRSGIAHRVKPSAYDANCRLPRQYDEV
jgi:hypothetical protein